VLSFASVHKFAHTRVPFRPSVHYHLFIKFCVTRSGHVPLCYHSHLFISCYISTSLRAIFASVHSWLHEGQPPCYQHRSSRCVTRRVSVPPCYHSHLFITLRYTKGHVPPCYHSHLFINLVTRRHCPLHHSHLFIKQCYTKGARPPCYHSHLARHHSSYVKMSLTLNIP
jgi:hypothetical protein